MIELQQAGEDFWEGAPGPCWRGAMMDGTRKAHVKCANGHVAGLYDHIIDANGKVMPSLICPEKGCDWHEHVRLVGWKP